MHPLFRTQRVMSRKNGSHVTAIIWCGLAWDWCFFVRIGDCVDESTCRLAGAESQSRRNRNGWVQWYSASIRGQKPLHFWHVVYSVSLLVVNVRRWDTVTRGLCLIGTLAVWLTYTVACWKNWIGHVQHTTSPFLNETSRFYCDSIVFC